MIKLLYFSHATCFMRFQHNPFNGLQNHFENYNDFKRAIRVRSKNNGPKLLNKF